MTDQDLHLLVHQMSDAEWSAYLDQLGVPVADPAAVAQLRASLCVCGHTGAEHTRPPFGSCAHGWEPGSGARPCPCTILDIRNPSEQLADVPSLDLQDFLSRLAHGADARCISTAAQEATRMNEKEPMKIDVNDVGSLDDLADPQGQAHAAKNPDPTIPAQEEDALTPSTSGEHGQNTSTDLGDRVKQDSERDDSNR